MSHNPFSPPNSPVTDLTPFSPPKFLAAAVVALFLIHIVIFAYYFGLYFELVRTGALAPFWPLLGLVADIVLFVGTILFIFKKRIKFIFFIAGIGFLVVIGFLWKEPLGRVFILITYGLGGVASFFGWWVASLYKSHSA